MQKAADNDELQSIVMEEKNVDLLIRCGYTKPVLNITTTDTVDIVQTVALQHVILDSLGELSQFCDGLCYLGVKEALCEHKDLMHSFFCTDSKKPLEAGTCSGTVITKRGCNCANIIHADCTRELFEVVQYSSSGPGSNEHTKETNTYMMFLDYVYECEEGKTITCTYNEIRLKLRSHSMLSIILWVISWSLYMYVHMYLSTIQTLCFSWPRPCLLP